MAIVKTKTARRRINTTKKAVDPQIEELARETYKANLVKNAANTTHGKARKSLYAEMKAAGLKQFNTTAVVDGKRVNIDCGIKTPMGSVVDIEKLQKVVSPEQFLQIVSATQAAVKEHVGEAIFRECAISKEGIENVNVTVVKG
tara:strand:- start:124 stop:555 length:432 start_codon:yes stop_codon:yes gene_type:complete